MENSIVEAIEREQKEICNKYGADFLPSEWDKMIGIAVKTLEDGKVPLNGLRHPLESEYSSNWYVWAGEEFSEAVDFFQPMHAHHLLQMCPQILKYLGLAPGWRFLVADGYEDVWFDANLLNI